MTKNEGAEITEDDLLEEPDVSLGEESQENVSTNLISSKIDFRNCDSYKNSKLIC